MLGLNARVKHNTEELGLVTIDVKRVETVETIAGLQVPGWGGGGGIKGGGAYPEDYLGAFWNF